MQNFNLQSRKILTITCLLGSMSSYSCAKKKHKSQPVSSENCAATTDSLDPVSGESLSCLDESRLASSQQPTGAGSGTMGRPISPQKIEAEPANSTDVTFKLTSIRPLVVSVGTQVLIEGQSLQSNLAITDFGLTAGAAPPAVQVESSTQASFVVPEGAKFGLFNLTLTQGASSQTVGLFFNDGKSDYPIITKEPKDVCAGEQYYDAQGVLQLGERQCDPVNNATAVIPDCSLDGQVNCRANTTYKSANTTSFTSADIKTGKTIGGVSGSLSNCSIDGEHSCITTSEFPATQSTGLAAKVVYGSTVAGIVGIIRVPAADTVLSGVSIGSSGYGTVVLPASGDVRFGVSFGPNSSSQGQLNPGAGTPASCSYDGQTNCVATTNFTAAKTIDLAAKVVSGQTVAGIAGSVIAESHINCTADGSTGCVANSTYTAALTTGLASKILSSNTVAGILGNVTLPNAEKVLNGVKYGVSGTSTTGSLSLPSAGDVYSGISYGVGGAGSTGSLTLPTGSNVRTMQGAFGRNGNSVNPSLSNCTSDGSTDCVTNASFKSADMTLAQASNIKNGVVIAGVTGGYPSSIFPLAGADSTSDLDLATFDARIKSATSFEWFDSSGVRHINTGDSDIAASNIVNGFSIFGTTGTYAAGSTCTTDGQISCLTTLRFKSMDTDATVISSWDIRKGKTAGGIGGALALYKNMANLSLYNRSMGTGALTGIDIYDTIDDNNNSSTTIPTQAPTGWDQATGANWERDSVSDTGGGSKAGNQTCDGGEICVYKDQISKLFWLRDDGLSRTWEASISLCEGLNTGGYSDWRLPTQKELLQAYTNGLWHLKDSSKLNLAQFTYYWSSSTRSTNTGEAWSAWLNEMMANYLDKTTSLRLLCVR